MDKVFELYVEGKDQPVRSATLTLPASIYEMVDTVERVGLEKVEEMYFEVEKSHRGECLADALEKDITLLELNILAWKVAEMDEEQEAILEGLIKMEQRKQGDPCLPYPKLLRLAENTACCHWVPQALNDNQLGRFYAENGFVEGMDDLPDKLFRLLDVGKIGREARLAECYDVPFCLLDHMRLHSLVCGYRNAFVALSYNDHPVIRELYQGFWQFTASRHNPLRNRSGGGRHNELIITNYDPEIWSSPPAVESVSRPGEETGRKISSNTEGRKPCGIAKMAWKTGAETAIEKPLAVTP